MSSKPDRLAPAGPDHSADGTGALAALASAVFSPLAHDLRAGLNGISVWTHLLERDSDEIGARATDGIRRAVAQQSILAQELSQFGAALTARSAQSPQAVDARALCAQVLDELRASHPARDLTLHAGDLEPLRTEPEVLRQIVRLLVLDAIAATPEGRGVHLALSGDATQVWLELSSTAHGSAGGAGRRRTLRQALAALAACMLGGSLDIGTGESGVRDAVRLPRDPSPTR